MSSITLEGFVEETNIDAQALTPEQCDDALAIWNEVYTALPEILSRGALSIAPASECIEADLPRGSTWIEVFATALDHTPGIPGTDYLRQLQVALINHGLLDNDEEVVW